MFIIRNEGLINTSLLGLGVIDKPISMLYTDFAILIGMLYVYLPLMVLPLYASMEKLDFRLVEAAYDLYATRLQVLRRIIVPLVKPGIIAGSLLVFIPALGAYVTPLILGGGKNMMIGNLIALQFGQGRNWPLGCAQALILMAAVVMVALYFYVRNTSGRCGMAERPAPLDVKRPAGVPLRSRSSASCVLYVPILDPDHLLVQQRLDRHALGRLHARLVCEGAASNEEFRRAAQNTLIISATATIVSTIVATLAAIGMTRVKPWRGPAGRLMVINLPLMVPEIITGVAPLSSSP